MSEHKPGEVVWGYAEHHMAEWWTGSFATREEAIAEARVELANNHGEPPFYVRKGVYPDPCKHVCTDPDMTLECIEESAADQVYAEDDVFEVRPGAEKAFETMMREWARRYLVPKVWAPVGEPEKIDE